MKNIFSASGAMAAIGVACMAMYLARTIPPLAKCIAGTCPTISGKDALFGSVLYLVKPDQTGYSWTDLENFAAIRKTHAMFLRSIGRLLELFESPSHAVTVVKREIPGTANNGQTPVTVYILQRKSSDENKTKKKPLVLIYHGGGTVLGEAEDPIAHKIASSSGAVVVAPEYRLAPDHPYPAGVEDCYTALLWSVEHADELGIDTNRVSVSGVSAGGLMAASVAIMAKNRRGPTLKSQYLGNMMGTPLVTESKVKFWDDHGGLTAKEIQWFWQMYVGADASSCIEDERCSPLANKDFSGLPEAVISVGLHDILLSEGLQYAEKLRNAGVKVHLLTQRGSHYCLAFESNIEQVISTWLPLL